MAVKPRLQLFSQMSKGECVRRGLINDLAKAESPPEPQRILNSMVSERHQAAVMVIAPKVNFIVRVLGLQPSTHFLAPRSLRGTKKYVLGLQQLSALYRVGLERQKRSVVYQFAETRRNWGFQQWNCIPHSS